MSLLPHNGKPSISVIMPVYNTEQFLRRSIDSVLSQQYEDIELICINDCSTDGSMGILQEYAARDARVRIVNLLQNGGPANARNHGLDKSSGEYIFFLDSDDWIDDNHLSSMVSRMESSGCEVVVNTSYVLEYPNEGKKAMSKFDWSSEDGEILSPKFMQWKFSPVIWASLYRRQYLRDNKIAFNSVKGAGEDIYFSGLCYLCTDKVYAFEGPAYHYWQRSESLVHGKDNGFQYMKCFRMLREGLAGRGIDTDGMRLFYIESLYIDSEERFAFVKSFMEDIAGEFEKNAQQYNDQDRFLMRIMVETPDYETYKSRYNPNVSMAYIRNKMRGQ